MPNKIAKAPASAAIKLENQYKPVGIPAIAAATLCKGNALTAKPGKPLRR